MPDHDQIEQNLDAYLAGGLSATERHDLEQHCAACSACAQQLMEGKHVDQLMNDLFVQVRPDAGLEDRALERLRRKPAKQRYGIMYFVFAAAAVVVLGLIGAVAQAMVDSEGRARVLVTKSQMDPEREWSFRSYITGPTRRGFEVEGLNRFGTGVNVKKETVDNSTATEFDAAFKRMDDRIAEERMPITIEPIYSLGIVAKTEKEKLSYSWESRDSFSKPQGEQRGIRDMDGTITGITSGEKSPPALSLPAPSGIGGNGPIGGVYYNSTTTAGSLVQGSGYYGRSTSTGTPRPEETQSKNNTSRPLSFTIAQKPPGKEGDAKAEFYTEPDKAEKKPDFFNPDNGLAKMGSKGPTSPLGDNALGNKRIQEGGYDQKKTELNIGKDRVGVTNQQELPPRLPITVEPAVEQPPPENAGRKIIRTGEMEFETDSFDAAINSVTTLISKVKGGFIATINSDKLPNGKVRGAIVVRMPPEFLDKFILDLRRELGKTGELKGQRIGSQDVTKQYTDIESELRAARAVETRLIDIIKTGKGEIKDLIAAERELGTWRTKIEKMEGEIRYYNNQVSLSTLTITLYEKEILTALAMVLREKVQMNIEVEEVEKAQDSIAAGVKAAKGRIVKNDLNVGEAGQVSAIVHVDVAPDSAPLFRELLKKLGTVSKYQAERTQQAEGGTGKSLDLKTRTDDVRFELNLYNTANIKPRETLHYKLGVADVAETYRTIREEVAKLKGQIRKSNLDEKDQMNVTAELTFNISAPDRAAINKIIAAAGFIVTKHTLQAAINETATDRTVGYELNLRNVAAIPPRDIYTIHVAAQDVPASYRKLHDAVNQFKGRIHKGQLNEQDKFNVSAVLDFDLATADKLALDKLIGEIGVTISRNNDQFPSKDDSTDQKVGYRLTLKSVAGATPREKAMLAMLVNDADARASQLKELVVTSKGRVMFSKREGNKNGAVKMVLVFELPHASLDTIVRQIKEGQRPLVDDKELNPQVPDNDLATAQIALTLVTMPDIVPTSDDGLWSMLRTGLSTAVIIFSWGVVVLISGLAIVVPWLIPIWVIVWWVRRNNAATTKDATVVAKPIVAEKTSEQTPKAE